MVNEGKNDPAFSTKARLVGVLRGEKGKPVSGGKLAGDLGISRVAVWKGVQSLVKAGYPVAVLESGYSLDPESPSDFLYPWEFGEDEPMFRYFESTGSTMDRTRECAARGSASGTVVIAGTQNAGKGRCGSAWVSDQGGLYFTVLERPAQVFPLTNYRLPLMLYQVAVARVLGSLCGKPARLRWPNDVYVGGRKIAGLMTELAGEGDSIRWLASGIGINVNNPSPVGGSVSCAEILGRQVSRRELLLGIVAEARRVKKRTGCGGDGGRLLADEWNSMADRIGADASLMDWGAADGTARTGKKGRRLAKGTFAGIDSEGKCVVRGEGGQACFGAGTVSLVYHRG
ncbi:MAG: biotin--[acetyl-CoA-carboxylase] ligase [Treponema sp.]|nr:biotin--[acetyl-CoA-carboxylase] ligase [Treponema sp.]MCL2191146.1 biotin--[acetyl-CoA-carboxylase] ligase [Treponema sp.]